MEVKSIQRVAGLENICTKKLNAPPQFNKNGLNLDSRLRQAVWSELVCSHKCIHWQQKIWKLSEGLNNTINDKKLQLTEKLLVLFSLVRFHMELESKLNTNVNWL